MSNHNLGLTMPHMEVSWTPIEEIEYDLAQAQLDDGACNIPPEALAASTMADAEIEGPSQTLICQLLVESKPLEALMDIIANGCDSDSPTLQEATYSTAQVRNLVNAVREELETYYQNEV